MDPLTPTPRTTLKRAPDRGHYERSVVHAILDEGLVCHLSFSDDAGQAHMIPTIYARSGETVYVHGSSANRVLRGLVGPAEACLCVTLLDGLVLGRSAFHQSMNFRSVILYGAARAVTDPEEKLLALEGLVEHAIPGRWPDVRPPNEAELARTLVLALPIEEASAKVRSGPPIDEEEDYALPGWAGVVPLQTVPGAPVADPRLANGIEAPAYACDYRRPESGGRA